MKKMLYFYRRYFSNLGQTGYNRKIESPYKEVRR